MAKETEAFPACDEETARQLACMAVTVSSMDSAEERRSFIEVFAENEIRTTLQLLHQEPAKECDCPHFVDGVRTTLLSPPTIMRETGPNPWGEQQSPEQILARLPQQTLQELTCAYCQQYRTRLGAKNDRA